MRKFKIGDRVKINNTENVHKSCIGKEATVIYVETDDYNGELVYNLSGEGGILWAKEDWLSLISKSVPEMTDDEIYDMLKPKMQKMGIDFNGSMTTVTISDYRTQSIDYYMPIEDVKRLVATVYRSGYGRGQKGRPFIIGGKGKQGHWVPCAHGEDLTPGTKLRRNYATYNGGDYATQRIPAGTEVEVLNGLKDIYVHVFRSATWISFPGGNNGENEKAYKKFHDLTGYHVIYVDDYTEYFDKWVEE